MAKKQKKKVVKKKVVKTTVEEPRARKADSLPPMIVPLPRKPKRTIPKDVTKRAPRAVPKRKSAVERERRVQFAKEHPLMQRSAKPPSLPTRLRGRPALDTSMLLAPLGAGPAIRAGIKGAKAASQNLGKRAATGLSGRSAARRKKPPNLRKRNTDYRYLRTQISMRKLTEGVLIYFKEAIRTVRQKTLDGRTLKIATSDSIKWRHDILTWLQSAQSDEIFSREDIGITEADKQWVHDTIATHAPDAEVTFTDTSLRMIR